MGVDGAASSAGAGAGAGLGALAAGARVPAGGGSPARSGMSDDEAAVTIRSTYRGYKTRKSGLGQDFRLEATNTLMERQSRARIAEMQGVDPYAATRSGAGGSSSRVALDEAHAATKIQATFRGHAARKEFQKKIIGFGAGGLTAYRRKNIGGRQLYLSGDALGDGPLSTFDVEGDGTVPITGGSGGWEPHGLGLKQWEHLTARQRARHIPAAPDGLATTDHPRGYRVRILAVEAYPFGQEPYRIAGRSNRVEVRASVSFYDEATGVFHGATCSSVPEEITLPPTPTPATPAPATGGTGTIIISISSRRGDAGRAA